MKTQLTAICTNYLKALNKNEFEYWQKEVIKKNIPVQGFKSIHSTFIQSTTVTLYNKNLYHYI